MEAAIAVLLSDFFLGDIRLSSRYASRHRLHFALLLTSALVLALAAGMRATGATAQVIEDQTLSAGENTRVDLLDDTYTITQGSTRGVSSELLFHSFDSFSIEAGQTAEFVLEENVRTIFSRVTGGMRSQIDGTISARTADFFLINPAGVIFGPKSSLEIGGSTLISTAESFVFGDGSEFSSTNPQAAPLLTISQPAGLSLGSSLGLSLGETAQEISIDSAILNFDLDQRVLFVGSGITFTAGGVIVPSGQVELVSLAPGSRIGIAPASDASLSLAIEGIGEGIGIDETDLTDLDLGDIRLLAGGFIDVSGNNSVGGRILLAGRQIDIEGGEVLSFNRSDSLPGESVSIFASAGLSVDNTSSISTDTFGAGNGGDIRIETAGAFELLGASALRSQSGPDATGVAGNTTIRAGDLSIRDGSEVSTSALGDGLGGGLMVDVPNGTVEISGDVSFRSSRLISKTQGNQSAGEIRVGARNLLVRSGGQIDSSTSGSGDSQSITIEAAESIVVSGQLNGIRSSITSSSSGGSAGDVGAINLSTQRLLVSDGGRIFTSTNGPGRGGDLTVSARDIVLSGSDNAPDRLFGLFARTESSGDSGRLVLTTESLIVRDGARLTVSTDDDAPIENLGTVREAVITAHNVVLDDGEVSAVSRSGNGGILTLNVRDFLLLRNNSAILATAGTAAAGGDGGNINIVMPTGFIIAVPNEDSDIVANAFSGMGGNIDINTQSIIGIEARRTIAANGTNDIDASSEFGIDGTIVLNDLELDPTEGTIELPAEAVSPGQIAERCLADSIGQNTFVVTGQGGVAPSPGDVVRNEALTVDVATTATTGVAAVEVDGDRFKDASVDTSSVDTSHENTIVEANGWRRDQAGTVVFVASDPLAVATNSAHYHSCLNQTLVQRE